ncbi:MAG TPA: DNA translocase FtsK 4TM domain-containing protein [Rhodospirillales bacterium]|nr:DNA translocase FtsK 4TM domain-containing protein [Rhodospirillales bacterium]
MARTMIHAKGGKIFPAGTTDFFRRRLCEGVGIGLLIAAAALMVAMISYSAGDPSMNSAGNGAARNLLGTGGAYVADALLQTLGLAGVVLILVLAAWGWKILHKQPISLLWMRFAFLLAAALLIGLSLAAWPKPHAWPLVAGLGGVAGELLAGESSLLLKAIGFDPAGWVLALWGFAFGLAALIFSCALTLADWRCLTEACRRGTAALVQASKRSLGFLGSLAIWHQSSTEPVLEEGALSAVLKRGAGDRGGQFQAPSGPGLVAPKMAKAKVGRKAQAARQHKLNLLPGDQSLSPPHDLLDAPLEDANSLAVNQDALQQNARLLKSVLEDFGIKGEIRKVRPGPVVTLYELEPAPGIKTSRVIALADDIARSMSATSVRIAVIVGRNVIGIELPNGKREMVYLRELITSDPFERCSGKLILALGKDIGGQPVMVDLARMPHILIAGTTGSGKSVGLNTMILSLLYQLPPEECKLIMIDPKMLELSVYEGIPHLLCPVVTDPAKAVVALKWAVREMEERYRVMSQLGVRNLAGYNTRVSQARKKGEVLTRRLQTGFDEAGKPVFEDQLLDMEALPFIVIVVDEMADLMLVAGKDVEVVVQRLAQMARAAGIHLIMATQRPSVDVITGTIKANFPTRVSFQVTSKIDSRTILGEQGAEQLLGHGDMLYLAAGGRLTRVHGPFVSDQEVETVVNYLKSTGSPSYLDSVTEDNDALVFTEAGQPGDELYDQALSLIVSEGKASTSFIQRHLQIGYNRAARIIERMEKEGLVSKANRVGRREVLIGSAGG